jgi:hypothetical protein
MSRKTIILSISSLLILGGSVTGALVLRERQASAAEAKLAAADSAKATPAPPPKAPLDTTVAPAPDSATLRSLQAASAADSQAIAQALPPVAVAPGDSTAGAAPLVSPIPPARFARLFGSMEPAAAAVVLDQMQDQEVLTVLASLRDRQAAAILSSLPPERAARLTQGALHDVNAVMR